MSSFFIPATFTGFLLISFKYFENLAFIILNFSLYPLIIFMTRPDLIIHDEKDNVGVVVIETTKKDQDCSAWIIENDKTVKVSSRYSLKLV